MKVKLTNCVTGKITEIVLDYRIEPASTDDKRIFKLIGGVTGYESFYLNDGYIKRMIKNGWCANVRTKDMYDGLFISAEEMKKVFVESGFMAGD